MDCGQTFAEGELDSTDVRDLLALHFAEMRGDSPREACHVLALDELRDPAIRFFSLRGAGRTLLGVGALKRLDPFHGEIKSMRTSPAALGRGVGRIILDHLVHQAREDGLTRLSLETGNSLLFAAARHLYESAGFARCGSFANYPDTPFTLFYTRTI